MEEGTQLSQRNEEVGGQQDHNQHSGERQRSQVGETEKVRQPIVYAGRIPSANHVLPDCDDDAGCRSTIGDHIHRGKRTQLNLQYIHGHHAELLGLFVHLLRSAGVGVEGLQCFQPLQIIKECGAHVSVLAPILFEYVGGTHRHQSHDQHDERCADEQRHSGRHIDRCHNKEQRNRRQYGIEQLGQEQFEETLNLLDALAGGLHHVGGAHTLRIRGAECKHLIEQFFTQCKFDPFGSLGAEVGCGTQHEETDHHGEDDDDRIGRNRLSRQSSGKRRSTHMGGEATEPTIEYGDLRAEQQVLKHVR